MFKIFLATLSLLVAFSSSAGTIRGTLEVGDRPLRVKRVDGLKSRFYKGSYKTEVTLLGERRKGTIFIERKGIRTHLELEIPRGTSYPENGQFKLPAAKTGQTFDVVGNVKTKTNRSRNYQDWESCIYYEEKYICERNRRGRRVCRWEEVPYEGQQEVEYHFITRTKDLQLIFNGNDQINFNGRRTKKNKVYTYRGECGE